jgi:hypothetical protein
MKIRLTVLLTREDMLGVGDGFVRFIDAVLDFCVNTALQLVKSFVSNLKLLTIELAHVVDLAFEGLPQEAKFVFEFGSESLQSVVDSFHFGFGKVTVGLDLALNVLEFGLLLLLALDALHEHDLVVAVHLGELSVHVP